MKIIRTILIGSIILTNFVLAQEDYWQQHAHYTIDVRLDLEEHQLDSHSNIVYTNNSPDELHKFYLIIYPNAFKEGSVKHRESLERYSTGRITKDNPSGTEISNFTLTMPSGATTNEFHVDDTIIEIILPDALKPGEQLTLDFDWVQTVRRALGRAGRRGNQYDMAQWYPKVVVYDENGWNNEPFHSTGEFYGEFSTFDVTLDLPFGHIVGATGVVTSGDPGWEFARVDTAMKFDDWAKGHREKLKNAVEENEDARRVVSFHAEEVHDFAWITSDKFVYESGAWNGIDVHVLFDIGRGNRWTKKAARRSEYALEWLSTKFGMYAYPQLTNTHAALGGGMEYPMLIMDGSESEGLILHETGHIWFYGILGNNEMEDAWLDEGFTTFQTRWYMVNKYGPIGFDISNQPDTWLNRNRHRNTSLGGAQWGVNNFQTAGYNEPMYTASYRAQSGWAYSTNAYSKPGLMLESLQYILGDEVFDKGMQSYYATWKLKHTNELRFVRAMEAAAGEELDWFFDQWIHTAGYMDYGLAGWSQKATGSGYDVEINIERVGPWEAPVVVELTTISGDKIRERWENFRNVFDGTFTMKSPSRVAKVELDPDDKLMDIDRRNNVSGRLPMEFIFKPALSNYNPRNAIAVSYMPLIEYNTGSGIIGGVKLGTRYGHHFTKQIELGYGINGIPNLRYFSSAPLFQYDTRTRGSVEILDQAGVRYAQMGLQRNWSRTAFLNPTYHASFNIAYLDVYNDTLSALFDGGTAIEIESSIGVSRQNMAWRYGYSFDTKTSIPVGENGHGYAGLTMNFNATRSLGSMRLNLRGFASGVWSKDITIPPQGRITVASANSMAYFRKAYLRADGALYGLTDIQSHYHLPGEGNLRGFLTEGLYGVEQMVSVTIELGKQVMRSRLLGSFGARGFVDAGMVWGDQAESFDALFDGTLLIDAGIGIDWTKRIFNQNIRLRLDIPLVVTGIKNMTSGIADQWIFSFQSSL